MHRPGIEPGTTAWKAAMLTITPSTLLCCCMLESVYQGADYYTTDAILTYNDAIFKNVFVDQKL
jgi:hypothetical protein